MGQVRTQDGWKDEPRLAEAPEIERAEQEQGEELEMEVEREAAPARPESKRQLRERVEARREHLQGMLAQLRESDVAPKERIHAIEIALQGLEVQLAGGWECVGELESAALARWLEGTDVLDEAGQRETDGAAVAAQGMPLVRAERDEVVPSKAPAAPFV